MTMIDIAAIRKDYSLQNLSEKDMAGNPIDQFAKWWQEAVDSDIEEVNAMTLATVSAAGKPAARIVLLKGFNKSGFVFYTNYNSRKGNELAKQPYAALVIFWKELQRQVRIEGHITKTSAEESDSYFSTRPEGSQLGAWASPQSKEIESREELEASLLRYEKEFSQGNIPRPDQWGGYIVQPSLIEFWQGRPNRLHDRIVYVKNGENWVIRRLAP